LREVVDVVTLAVQGVGGDHGVAEVADLVEQRLDAGDLVGLAVHIGAGQDHTGGLVAGGEDMRAAVSVVREPRSVLPSTATARLLGGDVTAVRSASYPPMAVVSRSGACRTSPQNRRINDQRSETRH
jgi:hypothetical protein